jgi:predicted DNA-binding protein
MMVIKTSEAKEKTPREKTSIKIKPEVWKEAKKTAIDEGKTVSELVEEAIEKWMKEHKKQTRT